MHSVIKTDRGGEGGPHSPTVHASVSVYDCARVFVCLSCVGTCLCARLRLFMGVCVCVRLYRSVLPGAAASATGRCSNSSSVCNTFSCARTPVSVTDIDTLTHTYTQAQTQTQTKAYREEGHTVHAFTLASPSISLSLSLHLICGWALALHQSHSDVSMCVCVHACACV
jgi:hypothetical protein